jgi:hypothetical protein
MASSRNQWFLFRGACLRAEATKLTLESFAPLILGRSSDPKLFFESEIISGPFDADKWVDTYHQYLTQSFVFGPPDRTARTKLAKAAASVLGKDFKIRFTDRAYAPDIRKRLSGNRRRKNLQLKRTSS